MLPALQCAALPIFAVAFLLPAQQATSPPASPPLSNRPTAGKTPQLVPRSEAERRIESHQSHEIVLNAFVADATGKPIPGLAENTFTILDNGKSQPITFFRPAQPPHVVLLLDPVNSSRWSYDPQRKAVAKYLTDTKSPLAFPVAIGWLTDAGIDVNPESREPATLLGDLRAAPGQPTSTDPDRPTAQTTAGIGESRTILPADMRVKKIDIGAAGKNSRFVLSVRALTQFALHEETVPGRIVVLWLGPGWPLLTGPGFLADTPEMKDSFFHRIADLENDLRDAQVTLNAVASPELLRESGLSPAYYAPFLTAVTAPDEASAANLALPVLALHSGGQVLDQNKDLASAIAKALDGLNSWYTLAFESTPSSQPDTWRPLQVTVSVPGACVRTTTGYYAQP
jgi:VWFA-related protein